MLRCLTVAPVQYGVGCCYTGSMGGFLIHHDSCQSADSLFGMLLGQITHLSNHLRPATGITALALLEAALACLISHLVHTCFEVE